MVAAAGQPLHCRHGRFTILSGSTAEDGDMASLAQPMPAARDDGFFLRAALGMAAVIVTGFSVQLLAGRSSFASPWYVHAHAMVFMGWIAIYLVQNTLVATGNIAWHRRLGWLGAGWIALMVVLGLAVTIAMVRRGQVPFFFMPAQFLVLTRCR
jgi:hypothetical protein